MEDHFLRIRAKLPLEYYIEFSKWVPRLDNPLHVALKEKVGCDLYISNENIIECNPLIDPKTRKPLNFKQILQSNYIHANEISIELRLQDIENKVLTKLKNGEEDYDFAFKINCLMIDTINSFLYFVRNELGQYFVELIPNEQKNWTLANFSRWSAEYRIDTEQLWHEFRPARYNRLPIEEIPQNVLKYSPIKKGHISSITSFICEGYNKSDMRKILAVNAKMHFKNGNYRMALVEAVILLESTIKYFLEKSIGKKYGQHKITQHEIESFWMDVGLCNMVLVGLQWWFSTQEIPDNILQAAVEAITTRNNVVHNVQRSVSDQKVKKYLGAIFALCDFLIEVVDNRIRKFK